MKAIVFFSMLVLALCAHAEVLDKKVKCSLLERSDNPVINSMVSNTVEFTAIGEGIAVNIITGQRFSSFLSLRPDGRAIVVIQDQGKKILESLLMLDLSKGSLFEIIASGDRVKSAASFWCGLVD